MTLKYKTPGWRDLPRMAEWLLYLNSLLKFTHRLIGKDTQRQSPAPGAITHNPLWDSAGDFCNQIISSNYSTTVTEGRLKGTSALPLHSSSLPTPAGAAR
jgi:hypothetical protein